MTNFMIFFQLIGCVLTAISLGLWLFMFVGAFAYDKYPETVTDEERVKAQIDR